MGPSGRGARVRTLEAATRAAAEEAAAGRVALAVYFDPAAESEHEAWGYCPPHAARMLFPLGVHVLTVTPPGLAR